MIQQAVAHKDTLHEQNRSRCNLARQVGGLTGLLDIAAVVLEQLGCFFELDCVQITTCMRTGGLSSSELNSTKEKACSPSLSAACCSCEALCMAVTPETADPAGVESCNGSTCLMVSRLLARACLRRSS